MRRPVLIAAALVAVACQGQPASGRDQPVITLTSLEGEATGVITERELRGELARLRFEREGRSLKAGPLPAELRLSVIERLVERRILLLEASRLGVSASTTAVARDLARTIDAYGERELTRLLNESYLNEADLKRTVTERLTVGRLLSEKSHAGVAVSEAEIAEAWATLPEADKQQKLRIRARQIVVVTEEEGKQALDELKRGNSFEEVAIRHSFAPEAARGGDLGWIDHDTMPAAFEPLFMLDVGKTSPLISTEYGFHVFRVEAKEEAKVRTLDDARPALEAKLLRAKLEKAETAWVQGVMSRYKIEKDKRALARIE